VLKSLIGEVTRPLTGGLKLAGWAIVIAAAVLVAIIFFSIAAFVWACQTYGTVNAALLLGAFYLLVALVALAVALVQYRRAFRRKPPPPKSAPLWKDPTMIAAGVELVRIIGVRRLISVVALGAALAAAFEKSTQRNSRS
jgi:hypothetical protein